MNALINFDSSQWIANISIPTLIIGSQDDITATIDESEEINRKIANSALEVLPGAHASFIEHTDKVLSILSSFLFRNLY